MKIDREAVAKAVHYELSIQGFQPLSSWPPSDAKARAKVYMIVEAALVTAGFPPGFERETSAPDPALSGPERPGADPEKP